MNDNLDLGQLTRIIPYVLPLPKGYKPRGGHFQDGWVPIDGLMIRGSPGGFRAAYICGLEFGARTRTQAMMEIPMHAYTLQAVGETFLELARRQRIVDAQDTGRAQDGPASPAEE